MWNCWDGRMVQQNESYGGGGGGGGGMGMMQQNEGYGGGGGGGMMGLLPQKRSRSVFAAQQQYWSQVSDRLLTPHSQQQPPRSQQQPLFEPSPLGLQLKKSPSFLDLIQKKLSQDTTTTPEAEEPKLPKKKDDKFKASNFAATYIKIGTWEYKTRNAGSGLTAKFYYAKHKLVWEVLHGGLKYKMEMQWSDISAIKAHFVDNKPATLSIALNRQPSFFRETDPQPKKHTLWQSSGDFTDGQASTYRLHFLEFPPGVLDKHFKKLIQCDSRLGLLSQLPQLGLVSPYFLTIGSNKVQSKDSACQSETPTGTSTYNLHDMAPISPPQLTASPVEQTGSDPLCDASNVPQRTSLGTTDDLSNFTQSPMSDALNTFDYGISQLEPIPESPNSGLNDVTPLCTPSSLQQQVSLEDLPDDIFGPAAGPSSGALNVAPLTFVNVGEQISLQDLSNFEVSREDLTNVEQQGSFGILHEDFSKAAHPPISVTGTSATQVNANGEARILENTFQMPSLQPSGTSASQVHANGEARILENSFQMTSLQSSGTSATQGNANGEERILENPFQMPSLQPSTSIGDLMGHIDLEKLHEALLSDSTTATDENFLMSKVNSFANLIHLDQNSENNPTNPTNGLVNSQGMQDREVLEPVITRGLMPEDKVQGHGVVAQGQNLNGLTSYMQLQSMPRNDSCIELLQDLPRITSLPHLGNYVDLTGNNTTNPTNGLVNQEGIQDRSVLEPAIPRGLLPENNVQGFGVVAQGKDLNGLTSYMQRQTMPRNDSCIELLHGLPRITSLPHLGNYVDLTLD